MRENLSKSLELVFGHEGGFTLDKNDKGNWTGGKVGVGKLKGTKFGVSCAAYPDLDIKNLKLSDAEKIYRRDYWAKIKGDALEPGLDYAVFDTAINSGVYRALQILEAAREVHPNGPTRDLIATYCALRLAFLRTLPSWKIYGKGWSTRVAKVAKIAPLWVGNVQVATAPTWLQRFFRAGT
jgi:lysozyme family protein